MLKDWGIATDSNYKQASPYIIYSSLRKKCKTWKQETIHPNAVLDPKERAFSLSYVGINWDNWASNKNKVLMTAAFVKILITSPHWFYLSSTPYYNSPKRECSIYFDTYSNPQVISEASTVPAVLISKKGFRNVEMRKYFASVSFLVFLLAIFNLASFF